MELESSTKWFALFAIGAVLFFLAAANGEISTAFGGSPDLGAVAVRVWLPIN